MADHKELHEKLEQMHGKIQKDVDTNEQLERDIEDLKQDLHSYNQRMMLLTGQQGAGTHARQKDGSGKQAEPLGFTETPSGNKGREKPGSSFTTEAHHTMVRESTRELQERAMTTTELHWESTGDACTTCKKTPEVPNM